MRANEKCPKCSFRSLKHKKELNGYECSVCGYFKKVKGGKHT